MRRHAQPPEGAPPVARIHLRRSIRAPRHPDAVAALIAAMHALRYRKVGWYEVPELPGLQLWGGVHVDGSAAIVYDHPEFAPFYDIVRAFADGTSATFSSTAMLDPASIPPGSETHADPRMPPSKARELLLARKVRYDMVAYTADNFASMFEDAYARGMDRLLGAGR